jgi:hypothetical protein
MFLNRTQAHSLVRQERISTPGLNNVGFFEDYFDGNNETLSQFWHVVNKRLSEAA